MKRETDLQDVQDREIDELTDARVVHLGALDDDGVGGQVDSPSERRRTAEYLSTATEGE